MSTLMERAATIEPGMRWIGNAQAQEEQTKSLNEVAAFLKKHSEEVELIVRSANALKEGRLLPDSLLPDHLQFLSEKLDLLRERLTSNPGDIRKNNFWITTQRALSASTEKLKEKLLELWRRHLDDLSPQLSELQDLIRSDIYGDELRRIRGLQNKIESFRTNLPTSASDIEAANSNGKELIDLVGRLDFHQIPPKVKTFLNAVLLRNVNLSELEPEVHAWLVDKNIAKGFRITSVRSQ
jgi:hypothetical protein